MMRPFDFCSWEFILLSSKRFDFFLISLGCGLKRCRKSLRSLAFSGHHPGTQHLRSPCLGRIAGDGFHLKVQLNSAKLFASWSPHDFPFIDYFMYIIFI